MNKALLRINKVYAFKPSVDDSRKITQYQISNCFNTFRCIESKSCIFIFLELIYSRKEALPNMLSIKFKNFHKLKKIITGFTLINEVLDFTVYAIAFLYFINKQKLKKIIS